MNTNAVVFGANGLVGGELVNELLRTREYERVITVTRKSLPVNDVKLTQIRMTDFSSLMEISEQLAAQVFFCCVGTTIKKAGTQEAFRKVDLDIPLQIARLAETLAIPHLVVISSIGANAGSGNFYLRTKGEMEKIVRTTYTGNLKIVRPSFLMGKRSEFRLGEKAALVLMKLFGGLFYGKVRKYRGIYAHDVAKAMIKSTTLPADRIIIESDELQDLALH